MDYKALLKGVQENSQEEKEILLAQEDKTEERNKERLRKVPLEMYDHTTSTVFEEAKKFWASPKGKDVIKRAKENGFK